MNGKIFLSGGGTEKDSFLLDKEFAKILEGKLLYVPIARGPPYKKCLKWIKKVFKQFRVDEIIMWTNLKNKKFKDLKEFKGIYLGGGNTFKLLQELKKHNFNKFLLKFHKHGGHIYGGSAGAIILGKNIKTIKEDKNEVKLKNLNGLNLVKKYNIWCHYDPEDDNKIKRLVKKENIKTIAIPEKSGVYIKNTLMKNIGKGRIFLFDKKKKLLLAPNTQITLK